MNTNWHTITKEEVVETLQSRIAGLAETEAKKRLEIYGYNRITEEKQRSVLSIFSKQFKEPLVIILLVAVGISFFIGDLIDAIVIIAIVMVAIIVGFVQEYRSEKAIAALKKMITANVRVIRDKEEKIINAEEIVPGDVIIISAGDRIPADSYLLESFNLEVNEAPLTGESFPVSKAVTILEKETPVADRKNILYMVTTVTNGRGKAIVFATGMKTELGRIASSIQKIEIQKTPFELKVGKIGKTLSIIMLVVIGVTSILAYLRGYQLLDTLLWAISLAVAAVPEALPAVIAASLALGVYRMAKQNAIVRRLPAVETLGSTTVICSDKTGTLTKGEMTVRKIYLYDDFAHVTGEGYSLDGNVTDSTINKVDLELLATIATACNDGIIKGSNDVAGDPTETALLVFAHKIGLTKETVDLKNPRIYEITFSSERKMMSTVHKTNDFLSVFTKGAAEIVLNRCNKAIANGTLMTLDENIRVKILSVNNSMAAEGLRVLAFAYKKFKEPDFSENNLENDLVFVGLAGMMDPPRKEAIKAVAQCKSAGIDVVMITGDHKLTAMAVAKELGLSESDIVMSGAELDSIDQKTLSEKVEKIKIYSRVSPENKIKIVQALKSKGHIVAMTGDGINDAPALKASDIGIAMGITGTQVTKESASMILADDNFATIVSAIREGRRIFDNVKKYLVYLLSANISEIIILAFSVIVGWPIPLLAKHILYINLATDGTPAISLGLEPQEPGIMKRKPRKPKESIFAGVRRWLFGIPILLSVIALSLFWFVLETNGWESEFALGKGRTMIFGLMVFFQLFFAISCRSFKHNLVELGIFRNKVLIISLIGESLVMLLIMNQPFIQVIFDLVQLELLDWIIILSLATTGFAYSEIIKFVDRTKQQRSTTSWYNDTTYS